MSIHFLHRAAVLPKAPPALFPDKLDDLLAERQGTDRLAGHAALIWRGDFEERLDRWADRLTARIEKADKS